jgi:hypothetical protein
MSEAAAPRTFVVTVRSGPERVVVEDVRGRRRAAAPDVAAASAQILRWLEAPRSGDEAPQAERGARA